MNDESKKIYPIGNYKKPERIEREIPAEHSADSDTVIDDALKKITEDENFEDVEMGKVNVD